MDWLVATLFALACFAFFRWRSKRARERVAEYAATGMRRSPLYLTWNILLLVLLGLMLSAGHMQHEGPIAIYIWLASLGLAVIALFFVRRALKWRYPV
jgi:hypothetical protein